MKARDKGFYSGLFEIKILIIKCKIKFFDYAWKIYSNVIDIFQWKKIKFLIKFYFMAIIETEKKTKLLGKIVYALNIRI